MSGNRLRVKACPTASQSIAKPEADRAKPNGFVAPSSPTTLKASKTHVVAGFLRQYGRFLCTLVVLGALLGLKGSGLVNMLNEFVQSPFNQAPTEAASYTIPPVPTVNREAQERLQQQDEALFHSTRHRRRMAEARKAQFQKAVAELNQAAESAALVSRCGSGGCGSSSSSINGKRRKLYRNYRADLDKLDLRYSRQPEVMRSVRYRRWLNDFYSQGS